MFPASAVDVTAEVRTADQMLIAQSNTSCRVGVRGPKVSYDQYNDTFYASYPGLGSFALTNRGGSYVSSGGRVVILTDGVSSGTWPFALYVDGKQVTWGECRQGQAGYSDNYRSDDPYEIQDPYDTPPPRQRNRRIRRSRNLYYHFNYNDVNVNLWNPKKPAKFK